MTGFQLPRELDISGGGGRNTINAIDIATVFGTYQGGRYDGYGFGRA